MITINNIEKILSINSQNVEVMGWECEPDYYEFIFWITAKFLNNYK